MRIDEIEMRRQEIKTLVNTEGADFDADALINELRSLDSEAEEIRTNAAKNAELRNMVSEETKNEILESKKENEKMEEVRTFGVDTVEYREAFLKKLMGADLSVEERAAMTASAAIPTETMNQIVHYLGKHPLLDAIDVTYIPGNVSYPVEGTNNDASWVAMGSAASDSDDALTSISLAAYKLIKTVSITADVQKMSIPAFEAWLTQSLADKLAKAMCAGVIGGGGSASNQCEGIKKGKNNTADGNWTSTGMKWTDLLGIIGALDGKYADNAKFLCNRQMFFKEIFGMVDDQKRPIVTQNAQEPQKFNIIGYPVIFDTNVASNELFFGDLKAYKFNMAKSPEITYDDSVDFRTGSRCWRGMALADGKLAVAAAIKYYTKST